MRVAVNAWSHFLGEGVQPHVATPSRVVAQAPHATVRQYESVGAAVGEPILLVPPLAVSITCFDLRPEQSLAAFLLELGRPVYVVDYGPITYADRGMGLEDWVDTILPGALRAVSARHGEQPVDIVTWSLGGTLSLLTAAAHPDLPLRSIAAVGTPIDYSKVPYLAPVRTLGRLTGGHLVSTATRAAGGLPGWAVQAAFKATALQREVTKPWFVLRNLHDADTIGRLEAVDRFIGSMPGYPGRLYGQIHHRLVLGNHLADGRLRVGGRELDLADVRAAVLIVAGETDVIAPVECVRRVCDLLPGAAAVRFETAPGSHLGVLTGPEALRSTWRHLVDFLDAQAAGEPASA